MIDDEMTSPNLTPKVRHGYSSPAEDGICTLTASWLPENLVYAEQSVDSGAKVKTIHSTFQIQQVTWDLSFEPKTHIF